MNNLEEKIKEIEKQLEELKQQLTEEDKGDKYKRKRVKDEYYWYVNTYGDVDETSDCHGSEDNFLFEIGNYFETEEQAENYKEKLLIEQELRDIAMKLNKVEEIDWDYSYQKKHYLGFNYNINEINFFTNTNFKSQGIIYCLNKDFKDVAIEKTGEERLAKYLKG